jgi:hypothetical protein
LGDTSASFRRRLTVNGETVNNAAYPDSQRVSLA